MSDDSDNPNFFIYIDEAGDDGLGRLHLRAGTTGQSKWFAVGACIVRKKNDRKLVAWRDEIAGAFPNRQRRDLHFKYLKHDQRKHACYVLGSKPIGLAVAMSNKLTLLKLPKERFNTFKQKNHLYSYVTRVLLERVSTCIKYVATREGLDNCKAEIVFSRRGGMNYEDFRQYMRLIKNGEEVLHSPGTIDWSVVSPDRITVIDHEKRAGLQLADIATSAFFKAVEPNRFDMYETSYAEHLRGNLIKGGGNGSALNYGITHIPTLSKSSPLSPEQRKFFQDFE